MKKQILIIAALIGLLASCREPFDSDPDDPNNPPDNPGNPSNPSNPSNPEDKTVIVFDNTQGICTAVVYDDYRRRDEDKITEIPAGTSSQEIEWTPGTSVPFYFLYRVNLKGISGFTLSYVPAEVGKDQAAVRVDANKKTTINIPKLGETLSSPDTLLSNNSILFIQNNSSFSFQLHLGSSTVNPDGSPDSAVVNTGERAEYTIDPGAVSSYRLLVGADFIPFPSSLENFEAGRVYVFEYDDALSLISEIELILENVASVSPNKPVPEAPGAPVVTASDGGLIVHWTAVENAEKYEVYINTSQNPPASPEKTAFSTVAMFTGLSNKTVYYVWVKAVNENGSSDFSPRARGIPWPVYEVPAVPEGIVIIPGINQLTVNWEASGGASSYEVYINTTNSVPTTPETTSVKTSAVIYNLQNNVFYYIWVRAVNSAGKSGYSAVDVGTPMIPTVAPAAPSRPVLAARNKELAVSWQSVELAESYEVWFGTSDNSAQAEKFGGDISGGITETTVTGLENETTYYVWVRAKNIVGTSGFSLSANAKPSAFAVLPEAPEIPTVISGNRNLSVSWQPAEGALSYEVWTGTTSNSANAVKHGADVSGTSLTLTGLSNGTTYYVWVKAKNNIGIGNFSPMASGIPSASSEPPQTPQSAPVVTAGNSQLTLSWQAVEGASAYELWAGTTINPITASKRGNDVSALSGTITGLTNGTTYYVWIKAKNGVGTSGFSPTANGTPSVFSVAPQSPEAPAVTIGNEQITVSWTAVEGTTAYEIWTGKSNNSASATKDGVDIDENASLSRTISGLSNGTTYYIWLKAKNNVGTSGFSPVASGKPLGMPEAPTVISWYEALQITWSAVPGADEYEVYYGTDIPTTLWTTTTAATTTITSLTGDITYYIRLRAKNSNGVSDGPSASGVPNNARSTGLYRGTEQIGNQNLSASVSYISANAVTGDSFTIIIGEDESVSPMTLSFSNRTVGITLIADGRERTITLSSNGSMFTINSGVTLTLDENITLLGRSTNTVSLVSVSSGELIINDGAKISGNTSTNQGGGVKVSDGTFAMNGGTISGNTASSEGGGIYASGGGNITINGGTINGNTANSGGGGIKVFGGTTLTMNGGTISGNTGGTGGGIYVDPNGTVIINSGTISGNTGSTGGGIFIYGSGTVTMHGGEISGNTSSNVGGGINVSGGTLTMYGGEISGNTARGGGIFVNGGTVTMNGGTISGNISNSQGGGGGIEVYSGAFTMHGGEISGNTARGGGIFVSGGTVTMNGGTIRGNISSNQGGGVEVGNGTFTMHGGVISGNTASNYGGGIYVNSSATFKKLPSGGGQNSGIIYGSEAAGVDADGIPLRNTSSNGPVVYSSSQRRNTTAGQTDHIDNTTGMGLSTNGEPPYGIGERTSGLYRGTEKIGNQNLSAALSYISSNAVDGDDFYIVLGADESISPMTLDYSYKTVGITLMGYGGERTVTLASNGSMFAINSGVTLTLDENITLVGRNTNTASLVSVSSGGNLVINAGAKISGNTHYNNDNLHGGGVRVDGNGTFTMNGGTISGNEAYYGGGIYNRGTFTLNGGEISGNGKYYGGGILNDGTFTMNGGKISMNTSLYGGGGIDVGGGVGTMYGGIISGNTSGGSAGGVGFSGGTFKKLPNDGGQNSGIIYGSEAAGVDADGIPLRNTSNNGHAVYSSSWRRNTTAGQTDHIDSTTGRGLSANGEPPFGE